jgi:hypothetical protein
MEVELFCKSVEELNYQLDDLKLDFSFSPTQLDDTTSISIIPVCNKIISKLNFYSHGSFNSIPPTCTFIPEVDYYILFLKHS